MKQAAILASSRLQARLLRSVRLLICLACLSLAQPFAAVAQTNEPAPLPPAAQEAVNKGIMAAKLPDYPLAIRYFEEARAITPDAPVIYLNMGLAESKIPGRELRAIAWFGAYLAAYPDAPNSAAVQEQIAMLEVRSQSNTSRLIKSAEDALNQPDLSARGKSGYLTWIANVKIKTGDLAGAKNSLGSALRSAALIDAQTWVGIQSWEWGKSTKLTAIAVAQIKAGDNAGALKTADLIPLAGYKARALSDIAQVQARDGDIAGAQKTFVKALKAAGLEKWAAEKSSAQIYIAENQIKSGDIAGALITLDAAQKTAELIQIKDAIYKNSAQEAIAAAQVKIRNFNTSPTKPSIQPVVTVLDWVNKLDDSDENNDCPLNTEPFLDLAGYLKALPSDDPWKIVDGMLRAVEKIVSAQNVISGVLRQEAKR